LNLQQKKKPCNYLEIGNNPDLVLSAGYYGKIYDGRANIASRYAIKKELWVFDKKDWG